MEFVTPLMLLGLLGIAIPVAIHLIGRRRAKRVPFAAIDFLLGSDRKLARRLRLRELLLLCARILVCLAIPLVLAKPYTACEQKGPLVERGPQAAVIVIDDSLASRAERGGERLIESARAQARTILRRLGPEAEVALLLTSSRDRGSTELSRDHVGLADAIAATAATYLPADTTGTMRRAAKLLSESTHKRRTIYLLSALAATGFAEGELPWVAGAGPTLYVIDLAESAPIENAAVTGIAIAPDPNAGTRGIRVSADIANFGAETIEDRDVTLEIAHRVVSRARVTLRPGETLTKRFAAVMPRDVRRAELVVSLSPDALPADDHRYAFAELRDQVEVLLVNGDPRTVRHDDELFYLDIALRPGDRTDSGFAIARTTVEELPRAALSRHDVVVLANARALPAKLVAPLVTFVEAGGGLLITMGSNVDPDRYNESMAALLPQALQSVLDTGFGKRGAERQGRALRLAKVEVAHPALTALGDDMSGVRDAAFSSVMLLGPTTKVDDRRVLARYDSGAAAMVEGRIGAGRVLLYTSSIDRDWTDLPIHPGYLPLWQQTIGYLGRGLAKVDAGPQLVGRAATIAVAANDERVEVQGPGDRRIVVEGDRLADRNRVQIERLDAPGFYQVATAAAGGDAQRRPELDLAINIDPRGSDTRRVRQLPTETPAMDAGDAGERPKRRIELWHALAAALLLFLSIESLLLLRS